MIKINVGVAVLLLGTMLCTKLAAQRVVHYELTIADTMVNFSGKTKRAIAANGQIPMPTLTFTEGDTAEIVVHNNLKESTSLHWHGLYVPNKEDGVPHLTQMPIMPGETFTYRFPIIQSGTHWYHSHSGLQEQLGMYGSLVLLKKKKDKTFRNGIDDLPAVPILLSEWTDLKPKNVQRLLHFGTDYFALKKRATQSYSEAIKAGHFKTKLGNEWKRMMAMDVSDVYYEKFLINGKNESQFTQFKTGDNVRLRIANGGASTYFWLQYAGGKMTVVSNDGNDVEPVQVDRLIIGVSETYDVVITIPKDGMSYEFLATSEDRVGSASVFFGSGKKMGQPPMPRLEYFKGMKMMNNMMTINGNMKDMGMDMSMQKMNMSRVMYPEVNDREMQHGNMKIDDKKKKKHNHHKMKMGGKKKKAQKENEKMETDHSNHSMAKNADIVTLNYAMLKSPTVTEVSKDAPVRELRFELTGNMNRYMWSMDNRVFSEVDKILIKKGEVVRIIMYNNSMMRHPMHLHGHDFRIYNGKAEYAPLKNVLDIMPMETDTVEFAANNTGDWFFHCHILYHMMAGMNRVFQYENAPPNPYLPNKSRAYNKLQSESNKIYFSVMNDFATNGNDGEMRIENTRWRLGSEWRIGYNQEKGYEMETHLGRYIGKNQWIMPFIGFDWRYRKLDAGEVEKNIFGQKNTKDDRRQFSIGVNYTLPMLVLAQAELYQDGNIRMQLMREDIPLTPRLRMAFMANTDTEYMLGFSYIIKRYLSLSTHYDSDMGLGIGVSLKY